MEPDDFDELLEHSLHAALQRGVGGLPSVPGYTLVRILGRGGSGVVYLARQIGVGERQVALKVLAPEVVSVSSVRLRFRREIRALAQLRHPAIVTIHDVVDADGVLAYAMEHVEGRTLREVIEEFTEHGPAHSVNGRIALAADVGIQIARALAAVHSIGFVHRDLKPSNILVRNDGTALLSDFGLARDPTATSRTELGCFVGTAAYSAPEQLRGRHDEPDARSDIFSLGATLYHLLAGRPPWPGEGAASTLEAMSAGEPGRLRRVVRSTPVDLETIIAKAVALVPEERYATAAGLAEDLERLRDGRPILARRIGFLPRAWRTARRNRAVLVAASVSALFAALAVAFIALKLLWAPGYVDDKLQEARSELLHYALEDFAAPVTGGNPGPYAEEVFTGEWNLLDRFERADAAYSTALLLDRGHEMARRERRVVQYAFDLASKGDHPPKSRTAALDRYSVAWKGIGIETFPEEAESALADFESADLRDIGLLAYLLGDAPTCMVAWDVSLDGPGDEDPLVDAARGLLLHEQGQHALAHSRLKDAARRFDELGFLRVRLAECSFAIGDLQVARNFLASAESLGRHDTYRGLERALADLAAFNGNVERAEDLYRKAMSRNNGRIARRHWGALAELQGNWERAVSVRKELVHVDPSELRDRFRVGRAARAWWNSLDCAARVELLAMHPLGSFGLDVGPAPFAFGLRFAGLAGTGEASLTPNSMDAFEAELRRACERHRPDEIAPWPLPHGPELLRLYACQRLLAVPRGLSVPLRPENRRLLAYIALGMDTWWESVRRTQSHDFDAHYSHLVDVGFSLLERRVLPSLRRFGSSPAVDPWPRVDQGIRPSERTRIGTSIVGVGDPDGDGLGDFVVSGTGPACPVWLYSGGANEPRWRRAMTPDGTELDSPTLLRVPDRDGDGWPEILVGVTGKSAGRGRVSLLSGSTGAEILSFHGDESDAGFGASLALAADRDGDGREDYIIGVPGHWTNWPDWPVGRVALHSSRDGAMLVQRVGDRPRGKFGHKVLELPPRAGQTAPLLVAAQYGWRDPGLARVVICPWREVASGWSIPVHPSTDAPVYSLASADLNRDGTLDLLVGEGAWGRFTHSRVVAADGESGAILWSHLAPPGDRMGASLVVLPDLDGDGSPEAATGAAWSQERPTGYLSIRSGRSGNELKRLEPQIPTPLFGCAVAWVDDQDGDGFGDLLVGSPCDCSSGTNAGAVFMISGATLLQQ